MRKYFFHGFELKFSALLDWFKNEKVWETFLGNAENDQKIRTKKCVLFIKVENFVFLI